MITKETYSNIPKFNRYVCIGDSITWNKGGWTIKATIIADTDITPSDSECYDEDQIKAWENDKWFFCGIVLSVSRNGIEVERNAASLWGIDCNFPGSDNSYLSEVAAELESEAIEVAEKQRVKMLKALQE